MKRLFAFIALSFSFLSSYAATTFITVNFVDNCLQYPGDSFLLEYPDNYGHDIRWNVPIPQTPTRGQIMIPATVGEQYTLHLAGLGGFPLCTFRVEADTRYHAIMTLISSQKYRDVVCQFSGNPNDNTAAITVNSTI